MNFKDLLLQAKAGDDKALFLFVILDCAGIYINGTVCRYIRDVEP